MPLWTRLAIYLKGEIISYINDNFKFVFLTCSNVELLIYLVAEMDLIEKSPCLNSSLITNGKKKFPNSVYILSEQVSEIQLCFSDLSHFSSVLHSILDSILPSNVVITYVISIETTLQQKGES